jgi:hypothetical protein
VPHTIQTSDAKWRLGLGQAIRSRNTSAGNERRNPAGGHVHQDQLVELKDLGEQFQSALEQCRLRDALDLAPRLKALLP